MNNDKIFALSSGLGKSGIAVIRISGAELESEFSKIIRLKDYIRPRHAYLTNLCDDNNNLIDQCIAIYFQAPNSFTGEDLIEIHCHGAAAVIEKVFELLRTRGCRIAHAGEFSRRAFYNNKMDLTEVDGLVALLDARTDKQRINALKSMTGNDSKVYESWRFQMIEIAAYAAAISDYASDELPAGINQKLLNLTMKLNSEISLAVKKYSASRTIRRGYNIALIGETNVGKSSLFNRLIGESRAIVSDIPGTTRDVITAELDIDGYLVNLSDTAGIRTSDDVIENIGIQKTHEQIKIADLIIRIYANKSETIEPINENEIIVLNKCDLTQHITSADNYVYVSAITGYGIDCLLGLIKNKIHNSINLSESDITINERTHGLLTDTVAELNTAISTVNINHDIFVEHVRAASNAIGKILGVICIDEIADATFSQLCLGK